MLTFANACSTVTRQLYVSIKYWKKPSRPLKCKICFLCWISWLYLHTYHWFSWHVPSPAFKVHRTKLSLIRQTLHLLHLWALTVWSFDIVQWLTLTTTRCTWKVLKGILWWRAGLSGLGGGCIGQCHCEAHTNVRNPPVHKHWSDSVWVRGVHVKTIWPNRVD